ncbi:MAG: PEP-CTERM sorting domain-containing protein [Phycisphaeraceae bacterium]
MKNAKAMSLVLSVMALMGGQASADILVNDTFSDAERSTQSLPSSVHWFGGSATTTLAVTSGALVLPATTQPKESGTLGFFTVDDSPLTLNVGDTLKLSFTITTPVGAKVDDNSFWYGFLDSTAGTRPTVDGSFDNARYNAYTGYLAAAPLAGAHTLRNKIVQRVGGANNLTTSANVSQIGATAATPNLAAGTYTFSLTMVRDSATQITLTSDMGGVELIRVDDATDDQPLLTAFDSVFIWTSNSSVAVPIDDILVEFTPAVVPEPASLALMGFGVAVVVGRRRRA